MSFPNASARRRMRGERTGIQPNPPHRVRQARLARACGGYTMTSRRLQAGHTPSGRARLEVDEAPAFDGGAARAARVALQKRHRHAARARGRLLVCLQQVRRAASRQCVRAPAIPRASSFYERAALFLKRPPWPRPPGAAPRPARKPPAPPPRRCGQAPPPAGPGSASSVARRFANPFISLVRASTLRVVALRGGRWPPARRAVSRPAARLPRPRPPACAPRLPSERPLSRASARWRGASRVPPR